MKSTVKTTKALILHGNGKLLDYTDEATGIDYRYAQCNTRAIKDCPFRSKGCEAVCYATKGNHRFQSVKDSRETSYHETLKPDFPELMTNSIKKAKQSKRYKNAVMIIRIHESGDFYSVQYLRKWIKIWENTENTDGVQSTLYTKSFPFFLMLTDNEAETINRLMESGKLSINLSLDDTTSPEQIEAYLKTKKRYPKMNTYYCTEKPETVEHSDICDCANCAKCGICNKANGKKTVVKIHSASNSDMETYRNNKTA